MRNFIRFLLRYHLFFLFLFLETISFYLLVNYNHHHRQTFLNSSGRFAAGVLQISSTFSDYSVSSAPTKNSPGKTPFCAASCRVPNTLRPTSPLGRDRRPPPSITCSGRPESSTTRSTNSTTTSPSIVVKATALKPEWA